MKYLQTAAIFMICLIINLPVYSSSVFAIGLTNVEVEGADNYDGFVRSEDDTFKFSVNAHTGEGVVNADQVKLFVSGGQGIPFQECSFIVNYYYECVLSMQMTGYNNICPMHTFGINLYNQEGGLVGEENTKSVCDIAINKWDIIPLNDKKTILEEIQAYTRKNECTGLEKMIWNKILELGYKDKLIIRSKNV